MAEWRPHPVNTWKRNVLCGFVLKGRSWDWYRRAESGRGCKVTFAVPHGGSPQLHATRSHPRRSPRKTPKPKAFIRMIRTSAKHAPRRDCWLTIKRLKGREIVGTGPTASGAQCAHAAGALLHSPPTTPHSGYPSIITCSLAPAVVIFRLSVSRVSRRGSPTFYI